MCEWCTKPFKNGDRTHTIGVLGFERYICGECLDEYALWDNERDYYGEWWHM